MERPFYEADEDRTNLVPSLQQNPPWVQGPDACAGVEYVRGVQEINEHISRAIHGQASTPHCSCHNAHGPTAFYDAGHGCYVVDSSTMSFGYSDVHNTPSNQGQGPYLTSNSYLAGTNGFTDLGDYYATNTAYSDASAAHGAIHATYDATNTVFSAINAAYTAGTDSGDLTRGIWPSTDPVSTLMSYEHGAADINLGVYPLVPNPTLAPGNLTTTPVQAAYEPAVANTNNSRPQCSTCNTTFKRASDLARHEKKHQARRAFKCLVLGCKFKGSYRKDKLDAHVKSCHPRGAA